ncbi:MAG TPA: hypothetical protein VHO66_09695 [Ruminiclostridium sp.]|nr:hypothetical protein [Ruminiclostridium sp.]
MAKKDRTFFISLGGMITALSIAFMFLTLLFPIAEFVFPAMAGILLISAVYEMGEKRALIIFAAVGILSLLLPISKSSAIYYIFFFGHYPIVKSYIERIHNAVIKWIVKILFFNLCASGAFFVSVYLFSMDTVSIKYGILLTALVLNVSFVLFDIALDSLISVYGSRIRKIIKRQ